MRNNWENPLKEDLLMLINLLMHILDDFMRMISPLCQAEAPTSLRPASRSQTWSSSLTPAK